MEALLLDSNSALPGLPFALGVYLSPLLLQTHWGTDFHSSLWSYCKVRNLPIRCLLSMLLEEMKVKVLATQSCLTLRPHGLWHVRLLCPWDSAGKNTGVGNRSLLQGLFLTEGSNLELLHCRQILYHLSHQGSS